jgi:hypothetical protein
MLSARLTIGLRRFPSFERTRLSSRNALSYVLWSEAHSLLGGFTDYHKGKRIQMFAL